jgi:type II secretory pathway component PulM
VNEWIAKARAAWNGLAPREQLLVGGACGLLAVAILYGLVLMPLLGWLEQGSERRETAERELVLMRRLAGEYASIQAQLGDVEERIRNGPKGNLRSTLQSLAQRSGVRVESMEPQASPANDAYQETKVAVGLKGVDLPSAVKYLHGIEEAPQVLSVKNLHIRSSRGNDQGALLDVTFTVSSFEPL